ncbi:hypothetical protein H2198_000113 [Neophaeococcomyces mojaviensis]|uniref:Uncharacterized protein n=1 Tax=Neophaeococcomyces mojaviensis TaxID=3383035 RepID=A0ACC3AKX4_9EURO|nr:hypothetical protein H2198_000113 [Knufia sp. JES_112]
MPVARSRLRNSAVHQQPPQPILEKGEFLGWRYSDGRVFGAIRKGNEYRTLPMAGSPSHPHPQALALRQEQAPPSQFQQWQIRSENPAFAPQPNMQYLVGREPAAAVGPSRLQSNMNIGQQQAPQTNPNPGFLVPWRGLRPTSFEEVENELIRFGLNEDVLDASVIGTRVNFMAEDLLRLQRAFKDLHQAYERLREDYEHLRSHACLGCGCQGSSQTPNSTAISTRDTGARPGSMVPAQPTDVAHTIEALAVDEQEVQDPDFDLDRVASIAHTAAEDSPYQWPDLPLQRIMPGIPEQRY